MTSLGRAVPRILLLLVVCSLFLAACAAPAIEVDEGGHACTAVRLGTLPGWATLLLGWPPPLTLPWIANPLLLVGCILLLWGRNRLAAYFGTAAALAGLTTWLFASGWKAILSGYYLWQGSLAAFALGALAIYFCEPARRTIPWAKLAEDEGPIEPAHELDRPRARPRRVSQQVTRNRAERS